MNDSAHATNPSNAVAIKQGDRLDQRVRLLTLNVYREDKWHEIEANDVFNSRKVIVFGLPGAFTPTCSTQHLPRYNEMAPTFFSHGIDEVICLSVNDPYVMEAWGRAQQCSDSVALMADGNGDFSRAVGMLVDKRDLSFGMRSKRYSMLVNDSVVEHLFVEPDEPGDPYEVSDADTMLNAIDPDARAPDQMVIFTRVGCPHCARAKELLERGGFEYVEMPLDDRIRHRVIGAISGGDTVPQIFLNGKLLGGADDLEKHLQGSSGPLKARPT